MKKLEGKVVLVTGGGSGIGKGIVDIFAREGASLAVVGAEKVESACNQYGTKELGGYSAAKEVAEALEKHGVQAIAIEADVTKWDDVKKMIDKTVETFGRIDILVNNAGVITAQTVEDMSEEEWDNIMDSNTKSVFLGCKAVIPQMKEQGGGKIINVASVAGKRGAPKLAHYSASKFAVVGFTNSLAKELAREGITVNAICPGIIATQMWKLLRKTWAEPQESEEESYERNVDRRIPQGIDQTPEDMGEAALFLALSDHVSGQAINVDGGMQFP